MSLQRPWIGLLIGAGALFALSAAPGLTWLDGGELSAAAWEMGIAHPPGAPLFILPHKLIMLLPIGDVAFRGNLASGLIGALALAVTYRALDHWSLHPWARVGGLSLAATSPLFALHAVTVEVYTGVGLLLALGLLLWSRYLSTKDKRWGALMGLWLGLLMAHHPELRLFAALFALALLLERGVNRWGIGVGVMGALTLLYLPLRAATDPWRAWGDPRDLSSLWAHWSGARIRAAYTEEMGALDFEALWAFTQQLFDAPLLLVLGLIGLALWARRPGGWLIPAIWLIDALYAVLLNPMGLVDQQNGLAGALMLGAGAALSVHTLTGIFESPRLRGAPALLALSGALIWGFWISRVEDKGLPLMLDMAADEAPPEATVFVTSDNHAAGWAFKQVVEGARLDLAVFVRQHLWDISSTGPVLRRRPALRDWAGPKAPLPDWMPVRWEWGDGADARWRPEDLRPGFPYFERPADGGRFEAGFERLRVRLGSGGLVEPQARRALANLLTDMGLYALLISRQPKRGLSAFLQAKELDVGEPRYWSNLGWALALVGRFEDAVTHCDEALRLDPGHHTARLNRARYLLQLGRNPLPDLEVLLEANPQHADALALRGVVRGNSGDLAGARADFEAALRVEPKQTEALSGMKVILQRARSHPTPRP